MISLKKIISITGKCQLCADQELCSINGAKIPRERNSSFPGNKPSFDWPKNKKNSLDSLNNDTPKPAKRKKSNYKKALSKKIDQNKKKDVKNFRRQKKYECKKCFQKSFLTLKGFQFHQTEVHGGVTENVHESNSYECKICNEDFSSSQGLKNHEKEVHVGKKHLCDKCNKIFLQKFNLERHIRNVHDGIKRACAICNKAFSSKESLERHIKVIHEGKIYKCKRCSKTYSYKNGLAEHTRNVHLNEGKEYKCETCGKSFRRKCYLKEHIKGIHEGKKYQCKTCEKSYVSFSMLKKHQATVHKGIKHIKNIHEDKKYGCELCKQSYMSLDGLKIHQTLAHDEINHSKKLEWVEDALNLPDVEEIFDEDENDLKTRKKITSIVIDHPNLVEEIQEPFIKKRKKIVPNLKEPIQESLALRKNCPNCNKSIDSKFLAKHIKNCKSQEVAIETDITEKYQDLDVSVEEILEDEDIIDLGPNHLLLGCHISSRHNQSFFI